MQNITKILSLCNIYKKWKKTIDNSFKKLDTIYML